jgi:hypothetical protein
LEKILSIQVRAFDYPLAKYPADTIVVYVRKPIYLLVTVLLIAKLTGANLFNGFEYQSGLVIVSITRHIRTYLNGTKKHTEYRLLERPLESPDRTNSTVYIIYKCYMNYSALPADIIFPLTGHRNLLSLIIQVVL